MKKVVIILCLATMSFSLDHITTTYHHVSGAVVSAAGNEANKDTLVNGINRVIDTLVGSYTRWSLFSNHDSVFKWMNIDTIKGPVMIDTIKGACRIDTVKTYGLNSSGNITSGTLNVSGSFYGNDAAFTIVGADTIVLSRGIMATIGRFSSRVFADTLISAHGISGTIGRFSSLVFGDSGVISKGVSATIGRFSSIVFGDSISSTKGISGTIGRFSSVVFGDSLAITKGISATIGRFSSTIFGTNATFSSNVTADSVTSTKGIYAGGKADVSYGGLTSVIGADLNASTRTNNTSKYAILSLPHYANAEEPVGLIRSFSSSTTNEIDIGGGSGTVNGATMIQFYTAANNTTTSGTERARINENGYVGIGTSSPSVALTVKGNLNDTGNAYVSGTITSGGMSKASYFTTNNEDSLVYEDTTFYDSLYDGATYRARVQSRIVRCGAQVTLYQGALSGTITATTDTKIKGIPAKFYPSWGAPIIPVHMASEGAMFVGIFEVSSTVMQFWSADLFYIPAGSFSVYQFMATWLR